MTRGASVRTDAFQQVGPSGRTLLLLDARQPVSGSGPGCVKRPRIGIARRTPPAFAA